MSREHCSVLKLYFFLKLSKKKNRVKLIQLNYIYIYIYILFYEQTKNKLFHLWNKHDYEMRYEIKLEYFLFHTPFYYILE